MWGKPPNEVRVRVNQILKGEKSQETEIIVEIEIRRILIQSISHPNISDERFTYKQRRLERGTTEDSY